MVATQLLEKQSLAFLFNATVNFIQLPQTKMWLNYDTEADVLYLHFEEKPNSNHSEMREDGLILDYRDNILVGLTILEASQRQVHQTRRRAIKSMHPQMV